MRGRGRKLEAGWCLPRPLTLHLALKSPCQTMPKCITRRQALRISNMNLSPQNPSLRSRGFLGGLKIASLLQFLPEYDSTSLIPRLTNWKTRTKKWHMKNRHHFRTTPGQNSGTPFCLRHDAQSVQFSPMRPRLLAILSAVSLTLCATDLRIVGSERSGGIALAANHYEIPRDWEGLEVEAYQPGDVGWNLRREIVIRGGTISLHQVASARDFTRCPKGPPGVPGGMWNSTLTITPAGPATAASIGARPRRSAAAPRSIAMTPTSAPDARRGRSSSCSVHYPPFGSAPGCFGPVGRLPASAPNVVTIFAALPIDARSVAPRQRQRSSSMRALRPPE